LTLTNQAFLRKYGETVYDVLGSRNAMNMRLL
jgi:hypothetical protein